MFALQFVRIQTFCVGLCGEMRKISYKLLVLSSLTEAKYQFSDRQPLMPYRHHLQEIYLNTMV